MPSFTQKLVNRVASVVVLALMGLGGMIGYRMTKSQMAAEVYRERLQQLSNDYNSLRETYNAAVKRTAVTELLVEDGRISVRIRRADGQTQTIPTDLNPDSEIYVDYVVIDGRLWIRRVFDQYTRPAEGVLIDTKLGAVEWDADNVKVGKAVYRRLTEGRWVVTVTGDGSLGLVKREDIPEAELTPPPKVRDYEQVEKQVREKVQDVGAGDVMRHLFSG